MDPSATILCLFAEVVDRQSLMFSSHFFLSHPRLFFPSLPSALQQLLGDPVVSGDVYIRQELPFLYYLQDCLLGSALQCSVVQIIAIIRHNSVIKDTAS